MIENNKLQIFGYVAILVIVISLLTLGFKLTGKVTDTGVLNVTIESSAAINFTTDFVDLGSGQVNITGGFKSANLTTLDGGTVEGGNWSVGAIDYFVIENTGNVNVSLQLYTGQNAASFIGGTSDGGPVYQYNFTEVVGEEGSCTASGEATAGTWIDVNATSPGTTICNPLEFTDAYDSIRIDVNLLIPDDATPGTQTDTFTATATAV